MPADPPYRPADVLHIAGEEQLRAVNNLVRHRILAVLRDGPATISQVATKLNLLKGSSSYHIRLLERAGLIRMIDTRRVRGVTERYYAPAARHIVMPTPGQHTDLMRHTAADREAAGCDDRSLVRMLGARLDDRQFDEFGDRLQALLDEFADCSRPDQPPATLAVALVRPPGDAGRRRR
jgi:DNA-binding transcriptional ArsR family regulator